MTIVVLGRCLMIKSLFRVRPVISDYAIQLLTLFIVRVYAYPYISCTGVKDNRNVVIFVDNDYITN